MRAGGALCGGDAVCVPAAACELEVSSANFVVDDRITLQTSVDGVRSTHDLIRGGKNSFTRTIANIERLAQAGKIVIVAMTANWLNFREVKEIIRRCVGAGTAAFRLGLTFPIGRAAQVYDRLLFFN